MNNVQTVGLQILQPLRLVLFVYTGLLRKSTCD